MPLRILVSTREQPHAALPASWSGMAGIGMREYAAHIRVHFLVPRGARASIQLVHSSDARRVLRDVSDVKQSRFSDLALQHMPTHVSTSFQAESGRLQRIAPCQQRLQLESAVVRAVGELTGGHSAAIAPDTPLMEAG
eukprot:1395304-Prymnesium_polylepis.1